MADDAAALHWPVAYVNNAYYLLYYTEYALRSWSLQSFLLTVLVIAIGHGEACRLLAVGCISTTIVLVVARTIDGVLEAILLLENMPKKKRGFDRD